MICGPRCALVLFALMTAGWSAHAQVGRAAAACTATWGDPVRATVDANGVQTQTYATNGTAVEIRFLDGEAHRLAYYRKEFSDHDVQGLLELNAPGMAWGLFRHTESPGGLRQDIWIRSDEGAMAIYEAGLLTISTGRWTQYAAKAAAAPEAEPEPVAAAPDVAPESVLVGYWQADGADGQAAMACKADGEVTWVAMSNTEIREFRGRFVSLGPEKPLRFELWRATRDREPLGMLVIGEDGAMVFGRRQGAGASAIGFWPIDNGAALHYGRVAAMPTWRVDAPPSEPSPGDTRQKVVDDFGKPRGTMSVGREEILSYPWGQVILEDGRVARVKLSASYR